jgi:hypothetical protein
LKIVLGNINNVHIFPQTKHLRPSNLSTPTSSPSNLHGMASMFHSFSSTSPTFPPVFSSYSPIYSSSVSPNYPQTLVLAPSVTSQVSYLAQAVSSQTSFASPTTVSIRQAVPFEVFD